MKTKFRARSGKNGEWEYFDFSSHNQVRELSYRIEKGWIFGLSQSTGLFDKNGKEAYFGDLLKLDDPKYHRCNEIEEIKFENGCFMVGNDNLGILNFVVDINGVLRGEIIGNIYYEDKHLLTNDLK